jgi:molecular chaperone HtpG
MTAQQFAFQAEINQLLSLIINAFYQDRDVFLRELISNASDAIDKIRYHGLQHHEDLQNDEDFKITICPDYKGKKTLVIEDNGIGMSGDDLIKNLGTIAHSGTKAFMEGLAANQKLETGNLIGQFGVGFYAAFLVAQEVEVYSRKFDSNETWCWRSNASGSFTVEQITEDDQLKDRGTRIILHLKSDCEEYTNEQRLRDIVKRHSDFCSFPIYLKVTREVEEEVTKEVNDQTEKEDDGEISEAKADEQPVVEKVKRDVTEYDQLNKLKPIWQRKPEDVPKEEYDSFYKGLSNDWDFPLSHKHFEVEGQLQFKGILYIPKRPPFDLFQQKQPTQSNIKLYVRKVFVTDKVEDLVPDWLSFVKGVIDSDDLPLNVSRETLQQNRIVKVISKNIVKRSIEMMQELSSAEDKEPWKSFYENFKKCLKLGVHADSTNREKLLNLLLFYTTNSQSSQTPDTMYSLQEYCSRMSEKQKDIYYITAENYEAAKGSPLLERLRKRNIEVILMTDAIDEYMMQTVSEYDGKRLVNLAKDGLVLPEDEQSESFDNEIMNGLCKEIQDTLKEQVSKVQVSTRLESSPCVLISDMYGWTANMERIMKAQALSDSTNMFGASSRKILEINPHHSIIKYLITKKDEDKKTFKDAVQLMHDTALISSGFVMANPCKYADKIFRLINLGLSGEDIIEEHTEGEKEINPEQTTTEPTDNNESSHLSALEEVD